MAIIEIIDIILKVLWVLISNWYSPDNVRERKIKEVFKKNERRIQEFRQYVAFGHSSSVAIAIAKLLDESRLLKKRPKNTKSS